MTIHLACSQWINLTSLKSCSNITFKYLINEISTLQKSIELNECQKVIQIEIVRIVGIEKSICFKKDTVDASFIKYSGELTNRSSWFEFRVGLFILRTETKQFQSCEAGGQSNFLGGLVEKRCDDFYEDGNRTGFISLERTVPL